MIGVPVAVGGGGRPTRRRAAMDPPNIYSAAEIINRNSDMCVTTDGHAGDQLDQEPYRNS